MDVSLNLPPWVRMLVASLPVLLLTAYGVRAVWRSEYSSRLTGAVLTLGAVLLALGMFGQIVGAPGLQAAVSQSSGKNASASKSARGDAMPLPAEELLEARVVNVIDGDTVQVEFLDSGDPESVTLIGADAPESTYVVDAAGRAASEYTSRKLMGKTVYLETDLMLRDAENRMLAYVWMADPVTEEETDARSSLFNAQLVLDGYARAVRSEPNVRYADYFEDCQAEAKENVRGVWADKDAWGLEATAPPKVTNYIANKRTKKFHRVDCYWVGRMNPENKLPYRLRSDCIEAGYVPCKTCNP